MSGTFDQIILTANPAESDALGASPMEVAVMTWSPPKKLIKDIFKTGATAQDASGNALIAIPDQLSITREQLFLSIGRTQTLSQASSKLPQEQRLLFIHALSAAVIAYIEIFVEAGCQEFAFNALLTEQADEARTSLASKVGAAIADLTMEESGYHWRANAKELEFTKLALDDSKKIPDFVYDTGDDAGAHPPKVVLVEAKGSLSKFTAAKGRLISLARKAYDEQVRSFVGGLASGVTIDGGCVVAFGAAPSKQSSTLVVEIGSAATASMTSLVGAASLSAAASPRMQEPMPMPEKREQPQRTGLPDRLQQTGDVPRTRARGGGGGDGRDGGGRDGEPDRRPNGRIAFANYESVFHLCSALEAARMLRFALDGVASEALHPTTQVFYQFDGFDRFLIGEGHFGYPDFWYPDFWYSGHFAIYRPSAEAILRSLQENPTAPPESVRLKSVPRDIVSEDGSIAVQADGLAWLNSRGGPFRRLVWDLRGGHWL